MTRSNVRKLGKLQQNTAKLLPHSRTGIMFFYFLWEKEEKGTGDEKSKRRKDKLSVDERRRKLT